MNKPETKPLADQPQTPVSSFERAIAPMRKQLTEAAAANPFRSVRARPTAEQMRALSAVVETGKTTGAACFLSVSPDIKRAAYVWRLNVSLVNLSNARPKSRLLWTKNETKFVIRLANFILAETGAGAIRRSFTPTSVNAERDLSADEIARIYGALAEKTDD